MGKYIQSVDDLIDDIQNKGLERGRLLFRGHANYEWRLLPSILRFENDFALRLEVAYLEPLLLGKKIPFLNTNDPIVLMMNLQHFGAPTRLLDWTFDPLIALFFACYDNTSKNDDIDGNLFFINKNLYKSFEIDNKENEFFKQSITAENAERFIKRSIIDSIYIIEPMIKNPRLRVQNACFMFFSFLPAKKNDTQFVDLLKFNTCRNKWLKENTDEKDKYWIANKLVDKNFKKSILNELDTKYGISPATIFVESEYMKTCELEYKDLYENAILRTKTIKSNGSLLVKTPN